MERAAELLGCLLWALFMTALTVAANEPKPSKWAAEVCESVTDTPQDLTECVEEVGDGK